MGFIDFTYEFIKLNSKDTSLKINLDVIKNIYNYENCYYCYGDDFPEELFVKAKLQMEKLLTAIHINTGEKYKLFDEYLKKIQKLNYSQSSKVDIQASFGFAKNTLEQFYQLIIKNYIKIDPSLINNFNISLCYTGAASNIRLAAEMFMDFSNLENIIYSAKVETTRALISEYIIKYRLDIPFSNQIHHINAYFDEFAKRLNLEFIHDKYAPKVNNDNIFENLYDYLTLNFLNTFINVLLEKLTESIGKLELNTKVSLNDKNYLSTLQNYNNLFKCKNNKLGIINLFISDINNLDAYTPIKDANEMLRAWVIKKLVKLKYISTDLIFNYNNIKYVFYGYGFMETKEYKKASIDTEQNLLAYIIRYAYQEDYSKQVLFANTILLTIMKLLSTPNENYHKIIQILKENTFSLNLRLPTGENAIFLASQNGHLNILKILISEKISLVSNLIYETPLLAATKNGHIEIVKYLVEIGENINHFDAHGNTALLIAAQSGYSNIVEFLINKNIEINRVNNEGNSALIAATYNGHLDIVKTLIHNGANYHGIDKYGNTPIIIAARLGYIEIIEVLLKTDANINQFNFSGYAALHCAILKNKAHIVSFLLKSGADINLNVKQGRSPLYLACEHGFTKVVETLLSFGVDVNQINNDGGLPLFIAAQKGYLAITSLLLKNGADVNKINQNGYPAIFAAIVQKHFYITKILLDYDVDLNFKHYKGSTALGTAINVGHHLIFDLILDKINNDITIINQVDEKNKNALHEAVLKGDEYMTTRLINNGVNINAQDNNGNSPLHLAIQKQHIKIVKILLMYGAKNDFDKENKNNLTPLFLAISKNNMEIINLLLQNNADIYQVSKNKITTMMAAAVYGNLNFINFLIKKSNNPNSIINDEDISKTHALSYAVANGHIKIVKTLIDAGADPHKINNRCNTPLHFAASKGYWEIVLLLLINGAFNDLATTNDQGETPITITSKNHPEIAQLLNAANNAEHYLKSPAELTLSYMKYN